MELSIGQKVAYPNQGVCLIESIQKRELESRLVNCYSLRVLSDNSTIFVPTENAESVGIRPIVCDAEYKRLLTNLRNDFGAVSSDWKIRSREYNEKLQSGDPFEAADVLKKLTFLSHEKKLSFREQNLLDKARFLIVSEIANAAVSDEEKIEAKVVKLVETACLKHIATQPLVLTANAH